MALNVRSVARVFKHDKRELPDPDPIMSPDDVMAFYSNQIPALTTATVSGPKIKNDKAVYEFKGTVGVKG